MAAVCEQIDDLAYAYADRELVGHERAALEAHLAGCAACRRRLQHELAFLAGIRARLAPHEAPGSLRRELVESLDRSDREEVTSEGALRRGRTRDWRAVVSRAAIVMAAAAAVAVGVSGVARVASAIGSGDGSRGEVAQTEPDAPILADLSDAPMRVDLIDRYIDEPVDVSAAHPDELARLVQVYAGVLAPPPRLGSSHAGPRRAWAARFAGDRRAVALEYRVRVPGAGRDRGDAIPVVVYAFDPRRVVVVHERVRHVAGAVVRVRSERGVTMVLYSRRGVGFALVSPMGEDALLGLIQAELATR